MTDDIAASFADPVQVDFFHVNADLSLSPSRLGPLTLPARSFIPKTGTLVSEFRPYGRSVPHRVIQQESASGSARVTLLLERIDNSYP